MVGHQLKHLLGIFLVLQQTLYTVVGECAVTLDESIQCPTQTAVCFINICDETPQCADSEDETSTACTWKDFITLQTPSIIWVERHLESGQNGSIIRGLNLGQGSDNAFFDTQPTK
ncbi:uncharacterized protein LOC144442009 [Glandiceps talaboti]